MFTYDFDDDLRLGASLRPRQIMWMWSTSQSLLRYVAKLLIMPLNETACKNSKQCAPAKHHFDECVERVTAQEADGEAKEDCVEECKLKIESLLAAARQTSVSGLFVDMVIVILPQSSTLPTALPNAPLPSCGLSSNKHLAHSAKHTAPALLRLQKTSATRLLCHAVNEQRDLHIHKNFYMYIKQTQTQIIVVDIWVYAGRRGHLRTGIMLVSGKVETGRVWYDRHGRPCLEGAWLGK